MPIADCRLRIADLPVLVWHATLAVSSRPAGGVMHRYSWRLGVAAVLFQLFCMEGGLALAQTKDEYIREYIS